MPRRVDRFSGGDLGIGGRMMRTIAVVALKGGSGKTTIAAHLALAAHLRGLDTLVVDIDPQKSTTEVLAARVAAGPDCIQASGAGLMSAKFAAGGLGSSS